MYVYLPWMSGPTTSCTSPSTPSTTSIAPKLSCWSYAPKATTPRHLNSDLRQDIGSVIPQVFPSAIHHHRMYLPRSARCPETRQKTYTAPSTFKTTPKAQQLKQLIYNIFDTPVPFRSALPLPASPRLKDAYTQTTPASTVIFDFLVLHWPKLVMPSAVIKFLPRTTPRNLSSAALTNTIKTSAASNPLNKRQRYLGVFEKVYRFTPFFSRCPARIRGKSPLQLAGYDTSHLPMAVICSGLQHRFAGGPAKERLLSQLKTVPCLGA